jgi:3-hydroxybutyryl-CoA dehydrogenase
MSSASPNVPPSVNVVAVLGAGTMGAGIAQVASAAGCRVLLQDVSEEQAAKGLARIGEGLRGLVAKQKMSELERQELLGRIVPSGSIESAVRDADIVVEAAPESLQLKREIFGRVDAAAPKDALLATNTSSLSIAAIAESVARPERFLGLHFFNPVPIMKLLEIVAGPRTAPEVVAAARAFAERLGKDPIVVRDSPGFASSRLGIALGLEAIRMVEEGVASPADIDKAMELGYRHPMGPLKLTDLVGLDVRLDIADYLRTTLDDRRFDAPALMRRMVSEGRLGKKAGRGFYEWDGNEPRPA